MTAFDFMGDHPTLTFSLALLACILVRAAFRWIIVMIHGYPPFWCDSEGRFKEEK
ncbi:hypothetical protein IFY47_003412 [Salmonella enterica]|nr:hypothetical protein [Escherichia coli]EHF0215355.1 hypothetical protein [Salmonella enterica]EJD1942476.1 hypothetical protein [Escherichia coli]EJM1834536.1 hypothetical protein [Salmonella enterica]EJT3913994.1 hypothetical protein [Salmonella enterica]